METFTATPTNIPAEFADNYVPFSFQYPRTWRVVSDPSNFVKVEEGEDNVTFENFAVGSVTIPAEADNNEAYPALMGQLSKSFAQNFPNFQELAQMPEDVGGYRGRSMAWQARLTGTPRGDVDLYGRVLLVREPGQSRGVALIMIATSLDPEVKSAADVGVKETWHGFCRRLSWAARRVRLAPRGRPARRKKTRKQGRALRTTSRHARYR